MYKLLLFLIVIPTLSSCQNNTKEKMFQKQKKYNFTATACAPLDYPSTIIRGDLFLADETFLDIPNSGTIGNTGWGGFGSKHIVGPEKKALPTVLAIKWVSYLEQKFYQGRFDLNYDLISSYFEKGYLDVDKKQNNFNEIKIGVAPGGTLVVWIDGPGRQIEIGKFKAKEVEGSIEDLSSSYNRPLKLYLEEWRASCLAPELQNEEYYNNIAYKLWDSYRKKYNWKPTFQFESGGTMHSVTLKYYNGEEIYTFTEDEKITVLQDRAIPIYFNLIWSNQDGYFFGADIYLGAIYTDHKQSEFKPIEQEIFNTYSKLFGEKKAETAELVFKIDKYNSHVEIFLKSEEDSIELKKVKVDIYKKSK